MENWEEASITFRLESPNGDQGFPGNAQLRVTYTLESGGALCLTYDAICDQDTVFNMTNHAYFNLAGHDRPELAMDQVLTIPARTFIVSDKYTVPTGELRSVVGTPLDFRTPMPIGSRVDEDYETLKLQCGYDHSFEVFTEPAAILTDPASGRTMSVITDCPGIHLYSGNYLNDEAGKDGVTYCRRSGVCLETQFWPDAVHHPQWLQPVFKAGERYHSRTKYIFTCSDI